MTDEAPAAEATSITFNVKASNDAKYTLTLPESTTVSDLKTKLSVSEYADTPAERQRLIYSGRVLKDNETLATYKIKDGHTIHLVKSAASNQRPNTTAQSSSTTPGTTATPSVPGVPSNIAAGTGNNPLAGLTGARYAGFAQLPGAGMFGPDGGMGPPPDPDAMLNMLENPQVQATMNEALQNPALIDMMIQQNPMLRDMGPGVRQMMQSPEFRRMLTDPAAIRQMAQMQRAFGGMGGGMGLGGGPGNAAFPAPGVTNTTPEENRGQQQTGDNAAGDTGAAPTVNPFGAAGNPFSALFGMNPQNQPPLAPSITPSTGAEQNTGANAPSGQTVTDPSTQNQQAQNPFAALFNPALFGAPPTQPGADAGAGAQAGNFNPFNPQTNPLLRDPAMLSNMMQAMGGGGGGGGQFGGGNGGAAANPWASMFGAPPAAPVDNRPPEERYEEQLRSLNDMGFCEFERNIEALRASGGSVQGAVEYLLSHLS